MHDAKQFYIDGAWVDPRPANDLVVINPATEKPVGHVSQASPADVDRAVAAARAAFKSYAQTSREERIELLSNIATEYKKRSADIAEAIRLEMGAPVWLANKAQTPAGLGHFIAAAKLLRDFVFDEDRGSARVSKEPVGVCALITPWNWPVNQIACKVAPALAAGCTMVLKPSEVAPLSAAILAQVLHDAGVPAGVFNLIQGDGPVVGARLAAHPQVDMVSFTGSTRGGIAVATAAAPTVKRVAQELGGKSANVILDDADLKRAVTFGVQRCVMNSGQSCNAPTRMLVAKAQYEEAVDLAASVAAKYTAGDPEDPATFLGPVVSELQWDRIQGLIRSGITDGARLVSGGTGRPEGLTTGFYVKPTIFADVSNDTARNFRQRQPVLTTRRQGHFDTDFRRGQSAFGHQGNVVTAQQFRAQLLRQAAKRLSVHVAVNDDRHRLVAINGNRDDRAFGIHGKRRDRVHRVFNIS